MNEQEQTGNFTHHRPRKLWWFGSFLLLIVLAELVAAGKVFWSCLEKVCVVLRKKSCLIFIGGEKGGEFIFQTNPEKLPRRY